jgi:hypothetical protein
MLGYTRLDNGLGSRSGCVCLHATFRFHGVGKCAWCGTTTRICAGIVTVLGEAAGIKSEAGAIKVDVRFGTVGAKVLSTTTSLHSPKNFPSTLNLNLSCLKTTAGCFPRSSPSQPSPVARLRISAFYNPHGAATHSKHPPINTHSLAPVSTPLLMPQIAHNGP